MEASWKRGIWPRFQLCVVVSIAPNARPEELLRALEAK